MRWKIAFAAAACLLSSAAYAQVRPDTNLSSFVDPATGPMAQELFGRSGYFMIAGGVVLGGSANFVLEQNGRDRSVDVAAVLPVANPDGSVSLAYGGSTYPVGMPAGLACPLGRFVARDGIIAYTIAKFMDPESRRAMMNAGLKRHRIAREFDGTPFETLLHAADFAETTPLPPAMAQELTASLNAANGINGFVIEAADQTEKPIGSLINTDAQVHYRVYLVAGAHRVEISGVPLRYFWELDRSGAAGVFAVDSLSQNFSAGEGLSNWETMKTQPTQYDVVNFYQVAGMFRQLHESHPTQFSAFVDQVCGERS
jgi:hypothetical protein